MASINELLHKEHCMLHNAFIGTIKPTEMLTLSTPSDLTMLAAFSDDEAIALIVSQQLHWTTTEFV